MKQNYSLLKGKLTLFLFLLFSVGISTNSSSQNCSASFSYYPDTNQAGTFYLYGNASGSSPINYFWNFSNGTTSTGQYVTVTFPNAGTYNVCLTISDSTGCSDSTCQYITSNGLGNCASTFSFYQDTNQLNIVYFYGSASGNGPFTYYWDFGDGSFGTQQNDVHTFSQLGSYNVCLTVSDTSGCQNTSCQTAYLSGNCFVSIGNVSSSPGLPSGWIGSQGYFHLDTLQAAGGGGNPPYTYQWTDPNGNVVSNYSWFAAASPFLTYCVKVTDANGCVSTDCYAGTSVCNVAASIHTSLASPILDTLTGILETPAYYSSNQNTYQWTNSNGNVLSTSQYLFGANANETYCLLTADYFGCADTVCYSTGNCSTQILNASVSPGFGPPDTLKGIPTGTPPFTYQWTDPNGNIVSSGIWFSSANPNYTYCLSTTDANGCTSTACYDYWVTSTCSTAIYQYTDTSNGTSVEYLYAYYNGNGTPVSYQWQSNGAIVDTTYSFAPNAPGQYCVIVTDNNGCSSTDCYYFNGNSNTCNVFFTSYEDSLSPGIAYFYSYPGGNAPFVYSWNFSDGSTDNSANPVHTFTQTNGWNYACLQVTDYSGCTSSYCDYVYVTGTSVGNCFGGANFDSYFNDINGTPGEVFFTDYSAGNIVSWAWSFGDGTTSTLQNPSHIFYSPGFYTICLTVTDSNGFNCSYNYCETNYIDTAWWGNSPWGNGNYCDAQFYAMQDSTVPGMVYIVDLSYGSNLYYTWTFVSNDGTINQTISSQYPFLTFNQFGCFNVCLTVTDTMGNCQDSYCDSICVDSLGNMSKAVNWGLTVIPSAIPESLLLSAKKETMNVSPVSVFPNPANEELNLKFSLAKSETIRIELLDYTGKTVQSYTKNLAEGMQNFKIDLSWYPVGIYFVKLNSASLNHRSKIVKMN